MKKGKHSVMKGNPSKADRVLKSVGVALAGTALCSMTVAFAVDGNYAVIASAAEGDTAQEQGQAATSSLAYSDASAAASKSETVYIFANADGSVKNTEVRASLTNSGKDALLKDSTDLKDIENVEGTEEFNQTDEGVVWDAQGEDIYYKGTSDKEAPVNIKISYQLDGKDISPDELLGKSGKVTIRFDYENNSYEYKQVNGTQTKIYTPFMAMTGLILNNDNFSNIEVENAKSIDDGDRTVVAGFALPGMQENLGIDAADFEIPDHFEVTADVENFEMSATMTMVTSDVFADLDTDDFDVSDLESSINKLSDAMSQLIDGSDQLVDGLNQLSDGANQLKDGTAELSDGANQLADGTTTMKNSTKSLPKSVSALNDGMQSLSTGIGQAATGSDQLKDGTSALLGGLLQMKNGTDTSTGLVDAVNSIGSDSDDATSGTLLGGVNALSSGMIKFVGPVQKAAEEVEKAVPSLKTVLKTLKSQEALIDKLNTALQNTKGIDQEKLQALAAELEGIKSNLSNAKAAIAQMEDAIDALGGLDEDTIAQLKSDAQSAGSAAQSAGAQAQTAAGVAQSTGSAAQDAGQDAQTAGAAAQSAASAAGAAASVDTEGMTEEQIDALNDAQAALSEAAGALSDSAQSLGSAATDLGSAAETMADDAKVLGASAQSTASLIGDVQELSQALPNFDKQQLATIKAYLEQVESYLTDDNISTVTASINALEQQLGSMDLDSINETLETLKTYIDQFNTTLKTTEDTDALVDDVEAKVKEAAAGVKQISGGLDALKAGLQTMRDGGTLPDGRTSAGLTGAVAALGTVDNPNTLIGGAAALNEGANELSMGLSAASTGATKLAEGTKQLNAAAPQLYAGVKQIDSGANALADGTEALDEGAGQLAEGAAAAAEGSSTLAEGLKQFNEEGIQKIVDLFEDNIAGLGDRVDAVVSAAKDYNSFSGITEGTEGSVKFVIQTDSISADEDADAESDSDEASAEDAAAGEGN